MTGWEKLDIAAKAIGAVLIPLAVAYVGHKYSSAISERQIQAKFVELGVSILQAPPSEETTNLRSWAIDVLNRYSGVPVTEGAKKDMISAMLPQTLLHQMILHQNYIADATLKRPTVFLMK